MRTSIAMGRIAGLEIDQEQCSRLPPQVRRLGTRGCVRHQSQQASVEKFHRGGVRRLQRGNRGRKVTTMGNHDPECGAACRHHLQAQFRAGDHAQGAFAANHQIEHVAAPPVAVQRIASGVLAAARPACLHRRSVHGK
jgi:hypothetical protein